jgi:hypothetical protein
MNVRLFVAVPAPAPITRERVAVGGLLAIAGVALVLLRAGGTALDSVWAEDGWQFLSSALAESFPAPVFEGFAGYASLVPRLLAELAALAPIGWAAAILSLSGAAVTVACAFVVWHASRGHLPDPMLRGFMAAAVIAIPVVGDQTLANVSYLQWVLVLPTFWLLLWRPSSPRTTVAAAAFIALVLASAPPALALAPLALARLVAARSRRDLIVVAGFGVGALFQVVTILISEATAGAAGWHDTLLSAYLLRVVGGVILGHPGSAAVWESTGDLTLILAGLALAALLVVCAIRAHPGRAVSLLALSLSVLLFLALGYQRDPFGVFMWPDGESNMEAARYTVVPALLLVAAILIQLQYPPAHVSASRWRGARLGVLAALAVAAATSYYVGDDKRSVKWSAEVEAARARCEQGVGQATVAIPTSPPGWSADIPCEKRLD